MCMREPPHVSVLNGGHILFQLAEHAGGVAVGCRQETLYVFLRLVNGFDVVHGQLEVPLVAADPGVHAYRVLYPVLPAEGGRVGPYLGQYAARLVHELQGDERVAFLCGPGLFVRYDKHGHHALAFHEVFNIFRLHIYSRGDY